MKNLLLIALLLGTLTLLWTGCAKPDPVQVLTEPPIVTSMTDSRDGEVYAIVTIGTQTWMAENLRYDVPTIALMDTVNPANPSAKYGRLYHWETLMNGEAASSSSPSGVQGLCPNGWHVPSDDEWNTLEIYLGMDPSSASLTNSRGTHAAAMKSVSGWSNNNGTNSSGFNALPAGECEYPTPVFDHLGEIAYFWSTTEHSAAYSFKRFLKSEGAVSYPAGVVGMYRGTEAKHIAYSCRCVQD